MDEITIEKLREHCKLSRTGAKMEGDMLAYYAYDFALAWIDNRMYEREFIYRISYLDKDGKGFTETDPWLLEFESIELAESK